MNKFETYSNLLEKEIKQAIENNEQKLIIKIRSYWNNESWEDIKNKFSNKDPKYFVWWVCGVQRFDEAQWYESLTESEKQSFLKLLGSRCATKFHRSPRKSKSL